MPSQFDISLPTQIPWSEQDRREYSRLPVWMAKQEYKAFSEWFRWKNLFGTFQWKRNVGDTLVTVRPIPSPVGSQVHRPRRLLEQSLINIYEGKEQTQQTNIKKHRYASKYLHWEGDFSDFRDGQVGTQIKDITRQIGFAEEFFIRDQTVGYAKRVYVCGLGLQEGVPSGGPTDADGVKTDAFWANLIDQIPAQNGTLDFLNLCNIRDMMENDLNIPFWEGGDGMPKDNEVLKGKYLIIGAGELYSRLTYDPTVTSHRPLAMNLLNNRFRGVISDNIVFQSERYPIRMVGQDTTVGGVTYTTGQKPPPEIEVADPANDYGTTQNTDIIVHPAFRNAGIGLAIMLGYSPAKTIPVGPPPAEFAGNSITMGKFNQLSWNGQVRATNNLLIQYANNSLDTNKWGDNLQLIAETTHGYLVEQPRFILPILYRRDPRAAMAMNG